MFHSSQSRPPLIGLSSMALAAQSEMASGLSHKPQELLLARYSGSGPRQTREQPFVSLSISLCVRLQLYH